MKYMNNDCIKVYESAFLVRRDNLPSNWNDIASQNAGSEVYTIAGSCSLQGTFSGGKAEIKVKPEGDCTKPSLKVIMAKLFPSINVAETTENFILPDKFDFEEMEIVAATKEVTVKAAAKDSWGIAERRLLLGDAKLTLGFTAGEEVKGMADWELHVVGRSLTRCRYTLNRTQEYSGRSVAKDSILACPAMGL